VDLVKYQNLFLEEAAEHLAEMSRALLCLEKRSDDVEAIDLVFRMAHSIKGMAASLGHDAVTDLAHALEDRMSVYRAAGRVAAGEGIATLFSGLEGLEAMLAYVRETGEPPPCDEQRVARLREHPEPEVQSREAPGPSEALSEPGGLPKKA